MSKVKFLETRKFLKAVVVIIIAVTIAIPSTYMFLSPTGGLAQPYRTITAPDTSTPEDTTPDPDLDTNDDANVIYSSGGGSSSDGGSSSNGDPPQNDNNKLKLAEFMRVPLTFMGFWGVTQQAPPIGPLTGRIIKHLTITIYPDGSQGQTGGGTELSLKGPDTRIILSIDIETKSLTGKLTYQGTTYNDVTGEYSIDSCDEGDLFIAYISAGDNNYTIYGHYLKPLNKGNRENGDGEPDHPIEATPIPPAFKGFIGTTQEATPISSFTGYVTKHITITINPDGSQEQTVGETIFSFKGTETGISMQLTLDTEAQTFTGEVTFQETTRHDVTGEYSIDSCDEGDLFIAYVSAGDNSYCVYGHYLRDALP